LPRLHCYWLSVESVGIVIPLASSLSHCLPWIIAEEEAIIDWSNSLQWEVLYPIGIQQ